MTPPTVPPSPAATPGPPVRPGAGAALKRVPTPVWLVAGGGVLGLGWALLRGGQPGAGTEEDVPVDETAVDPTDQPAPVAYVNPEQGFVDSGETVGNVGQTALESFTELFTAILPAFLETRPPANPYIVDQRPTPAPPPSTAGPQGRPSPQSNVWKPPKGYVRGNVIYGKKFPGALGWARVASGGKGAKHWIAVHIRFKCELQSWKYWPNKKGKPWQKLWGQKKPCVK